MSGEHDFDWLVIGSGFGGSVSALRLAEKGYRVAVLECGRRYEDEDFAKTTWNARRYYWLPRLGLRGIFRMTLFKDVFVVSGCGVGGGSLGYANTLYRPRPGSAFYRDPQWSELEDWEAALEPHYDTAERMLGVTTYEGEGPADRLLRDLATEMGVPETYSTTRVGVFFGEPGETVPTPTSAARARRARAASAAAPAWSAAATTPRTRWSRTTCGSPSARACRCCRSAPSPTSARSARPTARTATRSRATAPGAWFRKDRQVLTARGVVVAAGALGTNQLLQRCRLGGSLPRLSERIGYLVRTNSEAITAVTTKDDRHDFTKSIAITSSFYPDPDTHIENVTYGPGADSISFLFTILTAAGTSFTRPLKLLGAILRHPLVFARTLWPRRWSRRTVIILAMQTLDNSIRLRPKRNLFGLGPRLQTEEDPDKPNPRFIDIADRVTRRAAEKLDATPQSGLTEALLNIPTTAHIMGGAVIGERPRDRRGRRAPARLRLREPAGLRRRGDPGQHPGSTRASRSRRWPSTR